MMSNYTHVEHVAGWCESCEGWLTMTHLSLIHQCQNMCMCVCDGPCTWACPPASFSLLIYSHNDLPFACLDWCFVFAPWGRVLPLTDTEQQLSEIREVCYEGKTKKVQLSWTPQVRASRDQTVFSIYKGVKTFDLCQKHSLLVTGGMDKLIRMWNPHFSGWGIRTQSFFFVPFF